MWHVTCLDIYYLRNTYLQNNNFKQELILKATFCQKTPLNYILNSESFNNCLDSFYTLSVDKNRLFWPPPLDHLVIERPLANFGRASWLRKRLNTNGWHPQILAEQLNPYQPRGADYEHQIIMVSPDFQTFLWPRLLNTDALMFKKWE